MTYIYRVEATITTELEVEADSETHAEELVDGTLYPGSDDSRVYIESNEGIEINYVESDDDPEFNDAGGQG